jgi:hypothetical protein
MNRIILNQEPVDKYTFPQTDCLTSNWREEAVRDIVSGEKFVLCDCTTSDIAFLEELCTEKNYIVLMYPYPDSSGRFSAYFTPERRKSARTAPVEADD